ncbi:DUF2177 family protein [Radicibacter daui]|uniref:DUF2177 family protein n=1 Tax=Radicibacter daui TaxID=3064829 RepID=UPI004046A240
MAPLIAWFATGLVFLAIDSVWLTVMSRMLYRPLLGDLLMAGFRPVPALVFYAVYVGGMVFFAVLPALAENRWQNALLNGAVLGFVAYATYDLTNQATLRSWPLAITLADLAWGTVLTGVAATAGFLLTRLLLRLLP